MYQIRWVDSASSIPAGLWQVCFPEPFEGVWWYQALEQCGITAQFTFLYGVVELDGKPVAIAPAFLMDVPIKLVAPPFLLPIARVLGYFIPSLLYQRTLFIGSPCSDEGRVGIADGADRLQVLHCVHRGLIAKAVEYDAPMRVWKDVPAEYDEELSTFIMSEKLFRLVSYPGTMVRLEGHDKKAYLASLKASRRNKLKKKLKLAADVPLDTSVMQQPDAQTLDEIFDLFWRTYEKGAIKFERLNRSFFELIARYPNAYFIVIRARASGDMVAFALCFALGGCVINKFIGIDYSRPKQWFLYFRLWEAVVDWAYSKGADAIQSGQTGYAPKIELGHEMLALTNFCSHRNKWMNRIFTAAASLVNWNTLDADLAEFVKAYPQLQPKTGRDAWPG